MTSTKPRKTVEQVKLAEFGKHSQIDAHFTEGKFYVTLYAEAHKFHWSMDSISDFTKLLTLIKKTGHPVPRQIFEDIQNFCDTALDGQQIRGN